MASPVIVWRDHCSMPIDPYYKPDLALVHHRGFGFHADMCAPGILELLEDVRECDGLVLELGCGSGLLTKHLVDAGHRVIATDASPAMLDVAREYALGAADVRRLVLPHDPIPEADAIVSTGHPLNYLDTESDIQRALVAIAGSIKPQGVFALDICDLEWAAVRRDAPDLARVGDDWAIFSRFSIPAPDKYVREMTTFVRNEDGSWRRDDERHDNVLIDVSQVPALLAGSDVTVEVKNSFGSERLPQGLKVIVGHRPRDRS
jgi:SAM-dependent methyltransferase